MKKYLQKIIVLSCLATFTIIAPSCKSGNKKAAQKNSGSVEQQEPLMVFAAASLTDVLSEIIDSFEVNYPIKVQTNMASSGTLARQIAQGEIPDLYISASKRWADYVDSTGTIIDNSKTTLAMNELVLVAPQNSTLEVAQIDSSLDFMSLLGKERLSMGNPAYVPAGKYAMQSLKHYGWYPQLKGKILPAKDVRSALMVVEMEEAPLGIVYRTDAQKSKKVKILNTFPERSHQTIVYVGGICSHHPSATTFFTYLNSAATQEIWEKYGFRK